MDQIEVSERLRSGVMAIPQLGKLLLRLVRDPRVPRRSKWVFGAVGAYLILPFDVIPDWLPGIGHVDDLVLVALALDAMVNHVPEEILREHWDGEGDVLQTIRRLLALATTFVPERIKERLFAGAGDL